MAFRSATTAGAGSGSSVTNTPPAGLVNGDILLFWIYKENLNAITWPSGFTQILTIDASNSSFQCALAWKRANNESGNYTASWTGSVWRDGGLTAYSGAITSGDPQSGTAQAQANGATLIPTTPAMTTLDDNAMVIALCGNFSGYNPGSPPSGMTERVDFDDIGIADVIQVSAGSTGTKAFTANFNAQSVAAILALKPDIGDASLRKLELPQIDEVYLEYQPIEVDGWTAWQIPGDAVIVEQFWSEMPEIDETYYEEHDYAGVTVWQAPEDVADFQPLAQTPQIDEQYDEVANQEVNGFESWQVPESVEEFQSLGEFAQVDETYYEEHDYAGAVAWQAPEDVADFQPFAQIPQIDEHYNEVVNQEVNGFESWQVPENVEDFSPLAELPQIDEYYDEAFQQDFSGYSSWQIGENIEDFQSLGEFAQVDETYYEERDYAGVVVWQTPDDILDFQGLAELPQIDEQYDDAFGSDFSGFVYWLVPSDVEDALLGVVELPEMDERYSLVEEFFGWQTVIIEEPVVEEPIVFGEYPQMDERYELTYEYFGWQYPCMIEDVVLTAFGAVLVGRKGGQAIGQAHDQVVGVNKRQVRN